MRSFLVFLSLFLSPAGWALTYTLDDLGVLVEQNAFEEFFVHALDVRPTERQERWQGMVSKMADSMTASLLKKSEITAQDYKKVEDLMRLIPLKTDDVYRIRRQQIGLRFFKSCLRNDQPCWSSVKQFWEKDPSDPDLGLKLSELVEDHPSSPLPSWPFLEVALKSPLSEFYCKKPFVMKNLWDKFGIDYIRLGSEGDLLKKIDSTVHPDCLPSLNLEAQRRLLSPVKIEDRELAFKILEAQNKIDQRVTDFFYTLYLLERPSKGELFNYSWNRLKELGASESRRQTVLRMMKRSLKTLPDEIFSSIDVVKRRAVVGHLKANFPEYLDLYVHQCIQYFGGKGSFPEGNPTLNCQDFMASELAPKVLEAEKIKKYEDVKKI